MSELVKVGMAEYKVAKYPDSLISYGLGSCVGIAVYDPVSKVGGLAHIMLPESTRTIATEKPAKFADTAIPMMLNELKQYGGKRERIIAKIAGGAQMFSFVNMTEIMRIGERNTEAVRRILREMSIALVAEDTGGNYGRTVELQLQTGIFYIKTINKGEKQL